MVSGLEYEAMDDDRWKARKPMSVRVNAVQASVVSKPSVEIATPVDQILVTCRSGPCFSAGKLSRTELRGDNSVTDRLRSLSFSLNATSANRTSWFVEGTLYGEKVDFLIDTGAECTIINDADGEE